MKIGYRVVEFNDVGRYPADLVQISYWRTFGPDLNQVRKIASRCRELTIPFVIHPVFTPLSETRPDLRKKNIDELNLLADLTDLGMILHDETVPGGGRLFGERLAQYQETLKTLSLSCPVSIENANNTEDIDWFWQEISGSITLDLGHFESSGIDSVEKIKSLPNPILNRVDYVHIHRKNGDHGGILDHWPLTEDCREVQAFRELARRKRDLSVILEVNEMDQVGESLDILKRSVQDLDPL
jgi:sugar phosphate isomerase/epimerase